MFVNCFKKCISLVEPWCNFCMAIAPCNQYLFDNDKLKHKCICLWHDNLINLPYIPTYVDKHVLLRQVNTSLTPEWYHSHASIYVHIHVDASICAYARACVRYQRVSLRPSSLSLILWMTPPPPSLLSPHALTGSEWSSLHSSSDNLF